MDEYGRDLVARSRFAAEVVTAGRLDPFLPIPPFDLSIKFDITDITDIVIRYHDIDQKGKGDHVVWDERV
jgi:hypothetical protein